MADSVLFLHLTDAHLAHSDDAIARDERKVLVPGLEKQTRMEALNLLLRRLCERLQRERQELAGVLFSGDAANRGATDGHASLFRLISERLAPIGISPAKIVATPGNHDVPRSEAPGTAARHAPFADVWRAGGCVVPWLDGIDDAGPAAPAGHRLVAPDASWAVYPINTSNWSQTTATVPPLLRAVWDSIPEMVGAGDVALTDALRRHLESLSRYDIARISPAQLEALRATIRGTPSPPAGRQLRIAMMHHHLRAPSVREELKPFADVTNIEQLRALLRENGIDVLLHGHKHEASATFDHIYSPDGEEMHRVLVISGATYEPGRELDAARLVALSGLPHTPEVRIEALPLTRPGLDPPLVQPVHRLLWRMRGRSGEPVLLADGAPVVLEGSDLDEVYARACALAEGPVARGVLIIHLDLAEPSDGRLPLPASYPGPGPDDPAARQAWYEDLVRWWQLDGTRLEHRIPYHHGTRLRRYGGTLNQVQRIANLLKQKESTRAVAVLLDPLRDFKSGATDEEFASFCLVEFRRRTLLGRNVVDAIAFYRTQEIRRWWPINVAELRLLQREICAVAGAAPGRITTIAGDARTISRSPTQVAMPLIDRWLDRDLRRLHRLANHLAGLGPSDGDADLDWRLILADLSAAAAAVDPDGVPVAIEGLEVLIAYLGDAHPTTVPGLDTLRDGLRDLLEFNRSFERSRREAEDLARWRAHAARCLTQIRAFVPPGSR